MEQIRTQPPPIVLLFEEPNASTVTKWQPQSRDGKVIISYQMLGCCPKYADCNNGQHMLNHLGEDLEQYLKWEHVVTSRYIQTISNTKIKDIVTVSPKCFINSFIYPLKIGFHGQIDRTVFDEFNVRFVDLKINQSSKPTTANQFIIFAIAYELDIWIGYTQSSLSNYLRDRTNDSSEDRYQNGSYATVITSVDELKEAYIIIIIHTFE